MILAYKYVQKKRKERKEKQKMERERNDYNDQHAHGQQQQGSGSPLVSYPVRGASTGVQEQAVESAEDKAEARRMRIYRWKVFLGLALPFTLQGLDTTIVASALQYIAADFDKISQLNWIISAFNLTSAAFLPFWSQMADIFGRHITLQATLIIMIIGSAICTGSPNTEYGVLLLGRALQGIGASGVNICVHTILADRVSLKDFAVNWTIFALIMSVSYSVGPVLGGYLTQTNWRWCFAINLPIGVVSIALVFLLLRHDLLGPQPLPELAADDDDNNTSSPQRHRNPRTRSGRFLVRISTIDVGGQLLFLWGLGLFILALTWGGGRYAWNTPHVLAPLVIGIVLALAWIVYEYCMTPGRVMARVFPRQRAMIPWELLSQRDVGLLFFINFTIGTTTFANLYFMDLYFAVVRGSSSSDSGKALLYFLPGLGAGAFMAMFSSNAWPRQTLPALLLGALTSAVGITVMSYAVHVDNVNLVYGMMALAGHGVGMRMNPGVMHGLAYFPQSTAAISCLASFAMPFGGTVSLTLMTTVFNNRGGSSAGTSAQQAQEAIRWAFIAIVPIMWLAVVLSTFLGNVWILSDEEHEVVNGSYLWSLVTGRRLAREKRTRGAPGGQSYMPARGSSPAKDEEKAVR